MVQLRPCFFVFTFVLDKAVLENYHVAATYMILKEKEFNIFSNLSKADHKVAREKIINMVLATDMSQHFSELALLKTRLAAGNLPLNKMILS